jgi:hypothetical protein
LIASLRQKAGVVGKVDFLGLESNPEEARLVVLEAISLVLEGAKTRIRKSLQEEDLIFVFFVCKAGPAVC